MYFVHDVSCQELARYETCLNKSLKVTCLTGGGRTQSTVAAQLSQMLGDIPYISLDAIFWKQNWETATTDEFKAKLKQELEKDERGWVVDGNYHSKLGDYVEMQATDIICGTFISHPIHCDSC